MKSIISLLTLTFSLCISLAHADNYVSDAKVDELIANMLLKNTLGLRYGSPSSKQVVPINTKEVYIQHRLHPITGSLITPAFELSVSQLNVGEEKGYVYGFGPAMSIPIGGSNGNLHFTAHGKVHYLTRDDFGRKRYGGPVQWTYGFGIKSNLTINTFASYMWQHMSNGDVYEYNPALETHTITLGINF
ncbi:MAG: acyloxyacyl hydrolase [Gammaproteobacteria bacterium]|nr:acyloxyacyl hydrolase [Gammaproteobacteria bacterium]